MERHYHNSGYWQYIMAPTYIYLHAYQSSLVLDIPEVLKYINYLHKRFMIVSLDNDLGIACKKCYSYVIELKRGISDGRNILGDKVYKPIYQKANFTSKNFLSIFGMKSLETNRSDIYIRSTGLQNNLNVLSNLGWSQGIKCLNTQLTIEVSLALKCMKNIVKIICKL